MSLGLAVKETSLPPMEVSSEEEGTNTCVKWTPADDAALVDCLSCIPGED